MSDEQFDVIVLGAGSTGENIAGRTAAAGLSTAIVEAERAGGECSYWACMPSKTLLEPASLIDAAKRVPGSAAAVTGSIDVSAVLRSRDDIASHYDDSGQAKWIESAGITLVRGKGRLDGERRVVVQTTNGERVLTATKAVAVATGSRPKAPPIEGFDTIDAWDSRDATSAKHVPSRLAIIGGGVVAVEMATAWKSLGAQEVTLLVRGDRIIEREEPFASAALADSLSAAGITIRTGVSAQRVAKVGNGVELSLDDGTTLTADTVLAAAGRQPNSDDIGVNTVGLSPGDNLEVDDQLRVKGVSGNWLYAAGDVNGRALLTHMGKYQARLAADAIAGKAVVAWADHRAVTGVIFTDPQVASVGLRLATAREQGIDAQEVRVPWNGVAAAAIRGDTDSKGEAQIVIDHQRNVIVGATFVGPQAGELLHAATVAITGEVTLDRLWHAVPAYPTQSELWLRLLESYGL